MRILLDTQLFLWCIKDDRRLKKARAKILQAEEVYVSSASIWEACIKIKLKKLDADLSEMVDAIKNSGFNQLPITVHHAMTVYKLPAIHKDPFDRMLVAQAIVEPLKLFTTDSKLKDYSENLVEVFG